MCKGTWRHKNCLDMDLVVLKIPYHGSEYYKLRVLYQNRHNGILYNYNPETIKIYKKDFKNWSWV